MGLLGLLGLLGVLGLVLVVLAAAVVVALVVRRQQQRAAAAASGPRTVADLVRQRAESTDPALRPVTVAAPVPPAARTERRAEPSLAPPAEPAAAARPAEPAAAPPPAPEPVPPPEPVAHRAPAPPPAGPPPPHVTAPAPVEKAPVVEEPAEKAPRAQGPDVIGADTPWHRARLMAAGDGGAGTWQPSPEPAAPEPVAPAPAPANPVPVALRLVPPIAADGHDSDPEPDSTWIGWADWAEVDAEETGAENSRSTLAQGQPAPADTAPPPEPAPARAAVPTPIAPIPSTEPEAEFVALPLGRRTPEERAAEQAAADMALLRTFGYDPGARPDSAPVISMVGPDAEDEVVVDKGLAQPVRFRVVRRDGARVGGVAVALLDDRGLRVADVIADADGLGEVLAPAEGSFMLISTAADHQPGAVAVTVGDAPVEAEVLLARSASVSGAVQGEDGPIVGARVTLVQDGQVVDAVTTDAEGAYRIADIGSGEYGISVAAAGFVPAAGFVEVPDEKDLRHDAVLASASPTAGRYDDGYDDGYEDADDGMMTGQRHS